MSSSAANRPRYTQEELYNLLPAVYRQRDEAQGGPLKALLGVIAKQVAVLENDVEGLYDNWFIETCDPWVAPYIGDLVGTKLLSPVSQSLDQTRITGSESHRAYVADTIGYRRRKGTLSMLERLARDITGWDANCVEYFQLLGWTQFINHLRPENPRSPAPTGPESYRTPDLRDEDTLELLDSPFDRISHTVDVRHIASRRGRYNIPNVGVFLWRLQAMPIAYAPAYKVQDGCFTFSTLGIDAPLFNNPVPETAEFQLANEVNVPHMIRRREMFDNLQAYYANNGQKNSIMLITGGASLTCDWLVVPGGTAYTEDEVVVCDLTGWEHTPDSGKVAVDPVLGRIKFASDVKPPPDRLHVYYYSGFGGEVGGGFYQRSGPSATSPTTIYQVSQFPQPLAGCPTPVYTSISSALAQWTNDHYPSAVVQIMDSEVYVEALQAISIPAGVTLEIRAGQTPTPQRPVLTFTQSQAPSPAPLIQALVISGQPPAEIEQPRGTMIIDGIVLKNTRIDVAPGDLGSLVIRHSTLVPNDDLSITVDATPVVNWSKIKDNSPAPSDSSILTDFLIRTFGVGWAQGQQFSQTSNSEIDIASSDGKHTLSLTMSPDSTRVEVAIDGGTAGTIITTSTPSGPGLLGPNDNLVVSLERAITGGIYSDATASEAALSVCDSVIDKKRSVSWSNITTPGSPDSSALMSFLVSALRQYPPSTLSDVDWILEGQFALNLSNSSEVDISGTDSSGTAHTLSLTMNPGFTQVLVAVDGGAVGTMTVSGGSGNALLLSGKAVSCYRANIRNSTVFGEVETSLMDLGSDTIFTDTVKVRRVQSGCVRFSYIPNGSRVPRPYKCQPMESYPEGATPAQKTSLALQLKPRFTSETYGDPGYAELRQDGPLEIFQGADNGAEMGAFNYQLAALRLQNLNTALDEYLRFGLEAGAFLAS